MRLRRLIIGGPGNNPTQRYKNLKDVEIKFWSQDWVTVLIGWNGTGKSNILEALAIIFRDLALGKERPEFSYQLDYRCQGKDIRIEADPDRARNKFQIWSRAVVSNGENNLSDSGAGDSDLETVSETSGFARIPYSQFKLSRDEFLPRYIFGYYSGDSERLKEIFRPYTKLHDGKLRRTGSIDPGLGRLFYALPVHSNFVILSFILKQDDAVRGFLDNQLGLNLEESIDSVLFVLKEPPWSDNKKRKASRTRETSQSTPDRFWGAEGVARSFLERLHEVALAPIRVTRKDETTLWNKTEREYVYLFLKDQEALAKLVGNQEPQDFFRDLDSLNVSELLDEVRIRVKLKNRDGIVTFREMSEGEQQMLTVLGLLRFTATDESLFLLDEPDTHLNPRWSVDYLQYLEDIVTRDSVVREKCQILLTTHNPLAIANLRKEQIKILHRSTGTSNIKVDSPEVSPRGMGYAGIITSDMFGLGTTLDSKTNDDLIALHKLSTQKKLDEDEKVELKRAREALEGLDFNFASRDRLEQEFLRARFDLAKGGDLDTPILTKETRELALNVLLQVLLDRLDQEEK